MGECLGNRPRTLGSFAGPLRGRHLANIKPCWRTGNGGPRGVGSCRFNNPALLAIKG
uniref:Uncharacterized protein n=1 Tax=Pseudomonas putida TaxID=303 RepID=A0A6B7PYV5_PSEPU|nr:hypothetical protein [Pseudomonas putida]